MVGFYKKHKVFLWLGLFSGLFFATGMELYNYYSNNSFSVIRFIFYAITFGFFNGWFLTLSILNGRNK